MNPYSPQNCQDFRDLPSRNPVTKQDFDLVNNRQEFQNYLNNCGPAFTREEIFNKYDDKFCDALFSNLDQNGNGVEPWTGQNVSIHNYEGEGITSDVLSVCGFREHYPNNFPNQPIDCNLGGITNCITYQPENNRNNMINWINAQHRYTDKLQSRDIRLIRDYESMDSFRWNNVFRGFSKPCDNVHRETPDEFAEKFQRLYNLILKAPRTPRMYLFRGVRVKNFDYFEKEQDDNIIQMRGLTSYTIDMNAAAFYSFFDKTGDPNPNAAWNFDPNIANAKINIIEIPEGTPALFVSSRPNNVIEGKYEVILLPHTVKFINTVPINIQGLRAGSLGPLVHPTTAYKYNYMSSIPLTTYFPKGLDTISSESLINYFVDYCKVPNVNPNNRNEFLLNGTLFPSVIKGGFGITKLLNHRYKAINLIPTGDLDIEVYCDANFNTKVNDVMTLLNNFVVSLASKFPAINLTNRINVVQSILVENSETLCSIQFTPCGNKLYNNNPANPPSIISENIVDIKVNLNPNTFNILSNPLQSQTILDIEVSNFLGLPIKNIEAYLFELKDLLRRTIRPGGNANSRNPYVGVGSRRNKGRKTIERAKKLCSISVNARNNPQLREMCKILSRLSMKQILPQPQVNDLQSAIDLNARFGTSLDP